MLVGLQRKGDDGPEQVYVNPAEIHWIEVHSDSTKNIPLTQVVFKGGNRKLVIVGDLQKVIVKINAALR